MGITHFTVDGSHGGPSLRVARLSPELTFIRSPRYFGSIAFRFLYEKLAARFQDNPSTTASTLPGSMGYSTERCSTSAESTIDALQRPARLPVWSPSFDSRTDTGHATVSIRPSNYVGAFDFQLAVDPTQLAQQCSKWLSDGSPSPSVAHVQPTMPDNYLDKLMSRREELSAQLEQQIIAARKQVQPLRQQLQRLDKQVAQFQEQIAQLSDQLQKVRIHIVRLEITGKLHRYQEQLMQRPSPEDASKQEALSRLQHQIHWGQESLHVQRHRLEEIDRTLSSLAVVAEPTAGLVRNQRACLSLIESFVGELRSVMDTCAEQTNARDLAATEVSARLAPVMEALNKQIYSICGHLNQQQLADQHAKLETEKRQLVRCLEEQKELQQLWASQLEGLKQPVLIPEAFQSWLTSNPERCECQHHASFREDFCEDHFQPAAQALHEFLDRQNDLEAQLQNLVEKLNLIQRERYTTQQQLAQLTGDPSRSSAQRELLSIDERLRDCAHSHEGVVKPYEMDTSANRDYLSSWLDRVSRMLNEITQGHVKRIEVVPGEPIRILTPRGFQSAETLHPSQRDLLCLSMILAFAEQWHDHAVWPLILNEPFLHFNERQTAAVAAVLHRVAKEGRQILVFSENVSSAVAETSSVMTEIAECEPIIVSPPEFDSPWKTDRRKTDTAFDRKPSDMSASHLQPVHPTKSSQVRLYEDNNSPHSAQTDKPHRYRDPGWSEGPISTSQESRLSKEAPLREVRPFYPQPEDLSLEDVITDTDSEDHQAQQGNQPITQSDPHDSSPDESDTATTTPHRRTNQEATLRFFLNPNDPMKGAPSIGPKMAAKLEEIGVRTVTELLEKESEQIATELQHKRTSGTTVETWQRQARLMCSVPHLRCHDSQILVACGIYDAAQLQQMSPQGLWNKVDPFVRSKQGRQILRGGAIPDLQEITDWIDWAKSARTVKAA